jgi:hypothetical protein
MRRRAWKPLNGLLRLKESWNFLLVFPKECKEEEY